MNDQMNPLVQFSTCAGKLTFVTVPGKSGQVIEFENDMNVVNGQDRSMYAYAPVSGCPDAKQNQVLYVLRNENDEQSALTILKSLKLDILAEQEHFLVLFPNPTNEGWNYTDVPKKDSDIEFMSRCFNCLKKSAVGISGFNGMLFYVGCDPESSAMIATMTALRPATVAGILTGEFPSGYQFPENAVDVQTAAWCKPGFLADFLEPKASDCCKVIVDERSLDADLMWEAWDKLFSVTRRWQNDTYGHYQHRTDFTGRGFVAHVNDTRLGVNNGFPRTWYEYIPPQLRGTTEKVPLVFYFHGINCVPLYGAEQSNWHDIADRENFIVVYPAPAKFKAWNIFNLPCMPSDFDFVLALIEHMKEVHPIDETRIYSTGFSMGGAMTHALTTAYPEIFAAAAPCNAFMMARFLTPVENLGPFLPLKKEELGEISYSSIQADQKKSENPAWRMPVFQNMGLIDGQIASWPVKEDTDDMRTKSLEYWMRYNLIAEEISRDPSKITGVGADETFWEDENQRFIHQRWLAKDTGIPMLEMVGAKRMPHAIDPVQIEMAWKYIRQFSRMADGSLCYEQIACERIACDRM